MEGTIPDLVARRKEGKYQQSFMLDLKAKLHEQREKIDLLIEEALEWQDGELRYSPVLIQPLADGGVKMITTHTEEFAVHANSMNFKVARLEKAIDMITEALLW